MPRLPRVPRFHPVLGLVPQTLGYSKSCASCNRVTEVTFQDWMIQARKVGDEYRWVAIYCRECHNEICRKHQRLQRELRRALRQGRWS